MDCLCAGSTGRNRYLGSDVYQRMYCCSFVCAILVIQQTRSIAYHRDSFTFQSMLVKVVESKVPQRRSCKLHVY